MITIQNFKANNNGASSTLPGNGMWTLMMMKYFKSSHEEIFDTMVYSPINFFLTGSRLLETNRPDSDYDFFTADKNAEDFFKEHKFTEISKKEHGYLDSSIIGIYERKYPTALVQIQHIKPEDFNRKILAQEMIMNYFYEQLVFPKIDDPVWKNFFKTRKSRLWTAVMEMIEAEF